MDKKYIGISETQAIDPKLKTKQKTRAAAIVYRTNDKGEKEYLMTHNTNPLLNVTTFPLISSEHVNTAFLTETEGMKAIKVKTGYTLATCIDVLDDVKWTFRKPTENYNEDTLVKGFVFRLDSEEKTVPTDTSHEVVRKTAQQLNEELKANGYNGSSYLLWQRYKDSIENQKNILSGLSEEALVAMKQLQEGGSEGLRIVTDFDSTLTETIFHSNNSPVHSLIALLRTGGYLSESYEKASHALYNHYNALQHDFSLSVQERVSLMHERWQKHFDLMIAEGITKQDIQNAVTLGAIKRRDGIHAFFTTVHQYEIPVIILSAGITDMIEASLQKYGLLTPNVHIVANKFVYDEQDRIIAIDEPIIHSLNKDEHACKDFARSSSLSDRKNVIMMGDSLGDLDMVDPNQGDNLLTVGFFNKSEPIQEATDDAQQYAQKHEAYLKHKQAHEEAYDITIETGSARLPLAVLELIIR